jgi:glycosyltransferase involved in cell wall biosynthesis
VPRVLMIEFIPWEYRLQVGGHKYARGFLQAGWQVFWLTTFLNVNRLIRRREDDRYYTAGWRRGVVQPEPNLSVYTPLSLLPYINAPLLRSRFVAENSLLFTYPSLQNILQSNGFNQPDVLWMTNHRCYSILKFVQPKLVVYRMADDVGAFPTEPAVSSHLEEDLCRRADIVVATAEKLVDRAHHWSEHVYHVPNGVDFDFFTAPDLPIPTDLAALPRPRILYVGAIDSWFDFATLQQTAQQLPDYSFVLIGPVSGGERVTRALSELETLANVHSLGSRPFDQVRNYMRHADVGIIPFIPNALTHSISPIKLFEYLASGLTVVASRLHETTRIGAPVFLYDTPAEFVEHLRQAVAASDQAKLASVQFAKENSWTRRFDFVHQLIQARLDNDPFSASQNGRERQS